MSGPFVSDEPWAAVGPLRPEEPAEPGGGRPRCDDGAAPEGIVFALWSGVTWERLPRERFGRTGTTGRRRLRDRRQAGVLGRPHRALPERLAEADRLDPSRGSIGRGVHPGQRGRPRRDGSPRARIGPNPTERGRPGAGRPLVAQARGTPLGVEARAPRAGTPPAAALDAGLDAVPGVRRGRGRPRCRPRKLGADRACEHPRCRSLGAAPARSRPATPRPAPHRAPRRRAPGPARPPPQGGRAHARPARAPPTPHDPLRAPRRHSPGPHRARLPPDPPQPDQAALSRGSQRERSARASCRAGRHFGHGRPTGAAAGADGSVGHRTRIRAGLSASGTLPGGARHAVLHDVLPLPGVEASHLANDAAGVLLIVTRRFYRRLIRTWAEDHGPSGGRARGITGQAARPGGGRGADRRRRRVGGLRIGTPSHGARLGVASDTAWRATRRPPPTPRPDHPSERRDTPAARARPLRGQARRHPSSHRGRAAPARSRRAGRGGSPRPCAGRGGASAAGRHDASPLAVRRPSGLRGLRPADRSGRWARAAARSAGDRRRAGGHDTPRRRPARPESRPRRLRRGPHRRHAVRHHHARAGRGPSIRRSVDPSSCNAQSADRMVPVDTDGRASTPAAPASSLRRASTAPRARAAPFEAGRRTPIAAGDEAAPRAGIVALAPGAAAAAAGG